MLPMPRSSQQRSPSKLRQQRVNIAQQLATRAPSFKGLKPASEASSRSMRGNRFKNTKPEMLLQKELRLRGLRYRTHACELPGRPDLVFPGVRAIVFCDGDFWHGRNWQRLKQQLSQRFNADYWIAKIERNRIRDRSQVTALRRRGWHVLRYWESDIRRSPQAVANRLQETLAVYLAERRLPAESNK
jgi:DNA mismatch endonuclease (patch repair protein)